MISKYLFWLSAILLLFSGSIFYPRWKNAGPEAQLSWDAGGYYWYLPSVLIYHDLKGQHFKDSILQQYQPTPPEDFQYGYRHASGNYVLRYTIGTAILETPWFLAAHALAKPLGYPADGFSQPYQFAIYLGGLLCSLLGLWYLRKLLLFYYKDPIVALVLLLLVFGTNYLNYAGIDVGMTHGWLFTLYVFIFLNTHYYYQTFERKYALRLGGLIGLIALVRPPEIISVLIPLLWGMDSFSFSVWKNRLLLFRQKAGQWIPAAIICLLVLSLQFLYWKYVTGQWFVYTYQEQGFSWRHPHFKQYTLNYQCGWLVYTPAMLLAIAGIPVFLFKGKNRWAILLLIAVNYYIVCAWNAWDYGGRAMVQGYVALLFPLASLLQLISGKKWLLAVAAPVLLLCTYFNIWWTYQAHRGSIIGGAPATGAYFWKTALRYHIPPEMQALRDNGDLYMERINHPVVLYTNNLNDFDTSGHITVAGDHQDSLTFAPPSKGYQWIRASADVHIDQKEWNVWYMTQLVLRLKKGDEVIQENTLRLQRFLNEGQTKNIPVDMHVKRQDYDHIELLFRNDNQGKLPCSIDNLKVTGFNN